MGNHFGTLSGEIRTAEVEPRKIDVTKHRAREVDVIQGGVKPARKAPILFPTMVSSFVTASISSGESGWYILVVLVGRRIRGNRTAGAHLQDRIGGDCAWALRRSVAARRFEFGSRDTRTQVWGIVSIGGAFHFRIKELKAIWFCMPQASGLPCHAPAACTPSLTETT